MFKVLNCFLSLPPSLSPIPPPSLPPSLSPPLSKQTMSSTTPSSSCTDIYSGVLHKCGGRIKSWTKRWMVLRSDYCLYYYKDATKGHLGVISLRDTQFKIRVGQKSDVGWPKNVDLVNTFALVTTPRVYFMYAETRAEADEWRKVLEDAHQDLVEITRTKSFSGFRCKNTNSSTTAAVTAFSKSTEVNSVTHSNGSKPRLATTDSIISNASSVFGRQLVLSLSSEVGSPLAAVEEVESMYNVLQHPLVQDQKAVEITRDDAEREEGEEGEEGEREEGGGEMAREGVSNEAMYSKLPRRKDSDNSECEEDYVVPPDATFTCPQNLSITLNDNDRITSFNWADFDDDDDDKGAELPKNQPGKSPTTSLEAFYDFAHEVGESETRQQSAVYDEVTVHHETLPTNNDHTPSTKSPHKPTSARNQPLPEVPSSFSDSGACSSPSQRQTIVYEDIPDLSLQPPEQEILYEPVEVIPRDEMMDGDNIIIDAMYSEIEKTNVVVKGDGKYVNLSSSGTSEEGDGMTLVDNDRGSGEVGGYVNVTHTGSTPPLPPRTTSQVTPPYKNDDIIAKPSPKPRSPRPYEDSNGVKSDQSPSNRCNGNVPNLGPNPVSDQVCFTINVLIPFHVVFLFPDSHSS